VPVLRSPLCFFSRRWSFRRGNLVGTAFREVCGDQLWFRVSAVVFLAGVSSEVLWEPESAKIAAFCWGLCQKRIGLLVPSLLFWNRFRTFRLNT